MAVTNGALDLKGISARSVETDEFKSGDDFVNLAVFSVEWDFKKNDVRHIRTFAKAIDW